MTPEATNRGGGYTRVSRSVGHAHERRRSEDIEFQHARKGFTTSRRTRSLGR
jgi:hypothetical protein